MEQNNPIRYHTHLGSLLLTLTIITSGLVYHFYALNTIGVLISLALTAITFLCCKKITRLNKEGRPKLAWRKIFSPTAILYLIFFIIGLGILITHQTDASIISPWQIVPLYFFLFYVLATATLIIHIIQGKRLALLLTVCHYFLSFSVALFIYKLNYGFDPFIHQASLEFINKYGAIYPKTFYYSGQYGLEIIIHTITRLPLNILDKFLLPTLASILLPLFLFNKLEEKYGDKKTLLIILSLLTIPTALFIVTTPQNLAYLFVVLAIISIYGDKNTADSLLSAVLALASFFIHPLAGIPIIIFWAANIINKCTHKSLKNILIGCCLLFAATSLPLIFYYLNVGNITSWKNTLNLQAIGTILTPTLKFPGSENFILNFIYFYGFNLGIVFILITLIGFLLSQKKDAKKLNLFLFFSLALFSSYLLAKFIPFNSLINYERDDYANRILLLASLFLLPFIIVFFEFLISKILTQNKFIKASWIIFLIVLVTISLYLNYPRLDNYFNSRGYAVGAQDVATVNAIAAKSNQDYIVLSNQQVAAAALHEFGFKKYYHNNIFFYPIPTGGPLYQVYLDMVYQKPSRQNMRRAMDLAGVNQGYFVLNNYWWAFDKILEEAKLEANSWWSIGDGEVYVFQYNR